jgi:hypothetical protein
MWHIAASEEILMGRSRRSGRLLSMPLLIILIPLFLRIAFVKWWLILPLAATVLICYVVRIRSPFIILLTVAVIVVALGFFY